MLSKCYYREIFIQTNYITTLNQTIVDFTVNILRKETNIFYYFYVPHDELLSVIYWNIRVKEPSNEQTISSKYQFLRQSSIMSRHNNLLFIHYSQQQTANQGEILTLL